jgi:hypothetical protein
MNKRQLWKELKAALRQAQQDGDKYMCDQIKCRMNKLKKLK